MLRQPESMEELIYFTQRTMDKGKVKVWVFRQHCPKCKKALMGKPTGTDGKVKVRAKEYICPACSFTLPKDEYETSLEASIEYACPACGHEGEIQVPFKRKNINGVLTLRFQCPSCNANIDVTKKMKAAKKKKAKGAGPVPEDI